ncbi:MAG: glycosyltransferase family 4 protein [Balneolaceae bacterium]|nr:glycosyltransferase family 4 protein [Balneolaceae bacterium]
MSTQSGTADPMQKHAHRRREAGEEGRKAPSVLHLSESDTPGGAPRAGYRVHRAFVEEGMDSRMLVGEKHSGDPTVEEHRPGSAPARLADRLRGKANRWTARLSDPERWNVHYTGWLGRLDPGQVNRREVDMVHLQWFHGSFASVRALGALRKPVVWTLHDMWAFCGTEHYAPDGPGARWRVGYTPESRDDSEKGWDVKRWTWKRKQRHWRRPMHIVTPSRWLGACVRESALMGDWPVRVIPYALDLQTYRPHDQTEARRALGLPPDVPLVLFGAVGGGRNPRKGWDLLEPALAPLAASVPGVEGIVFGQEAPDERPDYGMPVHYMGYLDDHHTLARLYSAADLMAVPSRQDNLPQTGLEAQACGCPVVAFDTAGMPDVLEDGETGKLAEPFSSEDLARAMTWVLEDPQRLGRLREASRRRAEERWSPETVARQYRELYEEILQRQGKAGL